ncbi:TrkH family potassium uptake protein [Mesobacillus selenatarsenatis]|uniref:Potassium uptake protein, integral membrane component, KtrB n=1 Tax=Mesobacillus selenatarsenatis (strain DSM 18680 / JCM 14380 / FERM P-15431 / SF-1) TaxID=1321606 RepID=A0A0A8X4E0_MESS1|nr:TrkH family potassium uptake protein [Mesobacillus selenatarsenatis]GAM12986.1 potassium uptake protein, integral membrane component, KtrB [Mesobacillus selenatarsenatis SF-1]
MRRKIFLRLDPPKVLVYGFGVIILLGTLLLSLPSSTVDGKGLPFLDALFTATSATCVTGLVVVDTGDTFTRFGEMVILSMIQIGGLGFMSFATLFAFILGKRISFKERLIIQESLNNATVEGIVRLVKRIFLFTAVVEITGGTILSMRFSEEMAAGKAIYFGFFHAVSNFNNAGFDLMGSFKGLTEYAEDPIVNITMISLISLGGIGFIVMNELFEYRSTKTISLHSKIVLAISGVLIFGGALLIFILEYNNPSTLKPLTMTGKIFGAIYQAVTPRTAGSNTLNIPDLQQSTLFLIICLMFVGASPGSTGGGIKTTTFAVLIGAVKSQIRGQEDVTFFGRRMEQSIISKSLTVTLIALFLVFTITMILTITESGKDFLMIFFETVSAFSTVGLSMGLTPELSSIGKILITITMFAGRVGPLTLAFAVTKKKKENHYRYPAGKVMIG